MRMSPNPLALTVIPDPQRELLKRKRTMDMADPYAIDDQEMKEREEATLAYFGEDEQHFVDYALECIKESTGGQKDIRKIQGSCYNVYKENEPAKYAEKEGWQSRIVVPKPFATVQFGAAAVRKAFSPDFLSIINTQDKKAQEFWQRTMDYYLNEAHANFAGKFKHSTTMGLAIGQAMEMIPRWIPGKGLAFSLVEPWKIQRTPDAAESEDPQSGIYWIHQEWLDYFVLKQGESKGRYFDVARVKDLEEDPADPLMSKESVATRKEMIHKKNKYRKLILTSEIWGQILAKNGEMLLPSARYTIGANRVIQKPKAPQYNSLRWPGVSYSPLPDLLRFGGRGLLEGVLSIWEAWNNLMCMSADYLQWIVNPSKEILSDALVNPNDINDYPGHNYQVKETLNGQNVIRVVQRRSRTSDVLANSQAYDQHFQRGSLVNDAVQGLPGYRKDITFREASMNLDQSMGVFGLMGENIETGATWAVRAAQDTVQTFAGYRDYREIFTEEELQVYGVSPDPEAKNGVSGVPEFNGTFHISGIQALMKDAETLMNIRDVVIPLAERPRFAPYIKPFKVLKAIETRINLSDENVFATEEEAKLLDMREQLRMEDQQEAMAMMQQLQEAMGVVELLKAIQEIEATAEGKGQALPEKLRHIAGEVLNQ